MASKKRSTRKTPIAHVALVYTPGGSGRPNGSLACWVGFDKLEVAARAQDAKLRWGVQYRVLLGTLTEEVIAPVNLKIIRAGKI